LDWSGRAVLSGGEKGQQTLVLEPSIGAGDVCEAFKTKNYNNNKKKRT
jgi:hypothetical protein